MNKLGLEKEEERELFRKWKAGDEAAGNRIVEAFRPWAMTIAFNYSGGQHDEELRGAALEGLADAMRQFDLDRKVRLASFARIVVNQHIQRQIQSRSRAQDHLSFYGGNCPEHLSDSVAEDAPDNDQAESVARLMECLDKCEDINDRAKQILACYVEDPTSTLKTVGDQLGITKEGVRQHLLKIRRAVKENPELALAAKEAGLST